MRGHRMTMRASKKSFARKASHVNGRNIFNPKKLHKGGECIR